MSRSSWLLMTLPCLACGGGFEQASSWVTELLVESSDSDVEMASDTDDTDTDSLRHIVEPEDSDPPN